MSQLEWYYARDNKQLGPVTPTELKRLAMAGELRPLDLVWHEGMAEWASAQNVRGLFEEEGRGGAADQSPLRIGNAGPKFDEPVAKPHENSLAMPNSVAAKTPPAQHLIEVLLDKFRPHFNAHFIENTAQIFRMCGSYGLLAAAAVTAAFYLIVATKVQPLGNLLWGIIWVLALLTLQYVAGKASDAVEELNRSASGRLSSTWLPNCLAVLSKLIGVALLLGLVALAVQTSLYSSILVGVAAFLVCAYLAVIAMNPATLNISIAPETMPGEEAIGVVMFLLKALLRLVPVVFGVGVICGTIMMGLACCQTLAGDSHEDDMKIVQAILTADTALSAMISAAVFPLAAYLLFLLGNLLLCLWRSLLSLPGKLDNMAKKGVVEEKKP
jgi:hypothetical protein